MKIITEKGKGEKLLQKRKTLRKTALILGVVMMLMTLVTGVSAAPYIDTEAEVSLSIIHVEAGVPIAGEEFRLYKIAAVDKFGNFTAVSPFDSYPVSLHGENVDEWRGIAGALDGYALRDDIEPVATGTTDANGKLTFSANEKMLPGLYLVGATAHIQDNFKYISDPFCVTLPTSDEADTELIYNVTAKPKFSSRVTIDITGSYITRRVLKKWDDEGNEENRPAYITVQLLRDGEIFDTERLNKDNNWSYTWTDLDSNFQWAVIEEESENYNVTVSLNGITFLITNKYALPPGDEPTTGVEETTAPEGSTAPEVSTDFEESTAPEVSTDSEESTAPEVSTGSEESTASEDSTTSDDTTVPEEGSVTAPGDEPTLTPEDEEKIPNTGQLWWPVPMLVACGLFSITLGLLKRRGDEDEN